MLITPMLSRLHACHDINAVWSLVTADVVALLGGEFGSARLLHRDGVLEVVSTLHLPRDAFALIGPVKFNEGTVSARAARTRDVVVVADLEADDEFAPFITASRAAGFRAIVAAPLMDGQAVLGVVSAHFARPHCPSALELRTLRSYCREAGVHLRKLQVASRVSS